MSLPYGSLAGPGGHSPGRGHSQAAFAFEGEPLPRNHVSARQGFRAPASQGGVPREAALAGPPDTAKKS
jgi:hypothetical protein